MWSDEEEEEVVVVDVISSDEEQDLGKQSARKRDLPVTPSKSAEANTRNLSKY